MTLERRAAMAALVKDRDDDLLVVPGLGSTTWDLAAAGDDPRNFYLWGAMGGAAMIGLGLALAQPDRRVAVITGDGDVLMALGSLATIGIKQPKNLSIVCLDNGHYSATGMQPSATSAGIDLAAAAAACRFRVESVDDLSHAAELRMLLHSGEGPLFIHARVDADDQKRIIPSRDGPAIKQRFIQSLGRRG